MLGEDHRHLDTYVEALVRAGNEVAWPWRDTNGGFRLWMRDPIDFIVIRDVSAGGMPVDFHEDADGISCGHCWASIMGGRAVELGRAQHESWSRWNRDDGSTWDDHALFDPDTGGHWYVDVDKPDAT